MLHYSKFVRLFGGIQNNNIKGSEAIPLSFFFPSVCTCLLVASLVSALLWLCAPSCRAWEQLHVCPLQNVHGWCVMLLHEERAVPGSDTGCRWSAATKQRQGRLCFLPSLLMSCQSRNFHIVNMRISLCKDIISCIWLCPFKFHVLQCIAAKSVCTDAAVD